jgi:hypothetical protein
MKKCILISLVLAMASMVFADNNMPNQPAPKKDNPTQGQPKPSGTQNQKPQPSNGDTPNPMPPRKK